MVVGIELDDLGNFTPEQNKVLVLPSDLRSVKVDSRWRTPHVQATGEQ